MKPARILLFTSIWIGVGAWAAQNKIADAEDDASRNPRTIYFSVGDNQDLLWLPLDSRASINAAFDSLHQRFRASRIWWRGGQEQIWADEYQFRDQNRFYMRIWDWWKDLSYRRVGTNRIAVEAAHLTGMQIWLTTNLFDGGSPPDVGFGGFPYAVEDWMRVEHPEWTPVNRYGTWRQGGPIEFCYPDARKRMVAYLTSHIVDGGYDGIAFLSYAENFSQHYEDEFGYNQPIVDEFRRRHGVDIRTQPFDKLAWRKLRGEYLTQFMRELHASVARHGKKIAVSLDSHDPHLPCRWSLGGLRTGGTIYADIETWAKEGLIDDLNLFTRSTEDAVQLVANLSKTTKIAVSVFRTRGDLPQGVGRIMIVNFDVETGFDWETSVTLPNEKISVQPADSLRQGDVYARRRLLYCVAKGKQQLPIAEIIAATRDSDLLVRRAALRALAVLKDRTAIPAIQAALLDKENGVRCQASIVLAQFDGADCMRRLFEVVARPDSTFQFNSRAVAEALKAIQDRGAFGPPESDVLTARIKDANPKLRESALEAAAGLDLAANAEVRAAMFGVLKQRNDPYERELALSSLRKAPADAALISSVTASVKDPDEVVQVRAVSALAELTRRNGLPFAQKSNLLAEVSAFFQKYGKGCKRSDRAWGWREVGNGLAAIQPEGEKMLQQFMKDRSDPQLAELAWRVLYLRQGNQPIQITEEQDRENHARRPAWMTASGVPH